MQVLIYLVLLTIAIGVHNSPDKFSPDKNVCMNISNTMYTNVGTAVFGQDGKPVPCTSK